MWDTTLPTSVMAEPRVEPSSPGCWGERSTRSPFTKVSGKAGEKSNLCRKEMLSTTNPHF